MFETERFEQHPKHSFFTMCALLTSHIAEK